MAGLILDSMGTIKMQVLEKAMTDVHRINGLVEQMAANAKAGKPSASIMSSIKRYLTTMAAQLKAQFGMISDAVTNVYISSSRGSNDQSRARMLKEGVAAIKQAIEIGIAQTKEKHAVHREKTAPSASPE
jgi:hypothetical protein